MSNTKSSRAFGVLQRVGRAFMLPIALLPVAGLLLGIGSSLTNTAMLEAYNLTGLLGPGTNPWGSTDGHGAGRRYYFCQSADSLCYGCSTGNG